MTAERVKDPFDQLLDACQTALTFVAEREERGRAEALRRGEQRQRIEAAIKALTGEMPAKRRGRVVWTEEMRQAASDRAKRLVAEGKLGRAVHDGRRRRREPKSGDVRLSDLRFPGAGAVGGRMGSHWLLPEEPN